MYEEKEDYTKDRDTRKNRREASKNHKKKIERKNRLTPYNHNERRVKFDDE